MVVESVSVQDLANLAGKNDYEKLNSILAKAGKEQLEDLLRKAVTAISLMQE